MPRPAARFAAALAAQRLRSRLIEGRIRRPRLRQVTAAQPQMPPLLDLLPLQSILAGDQRLDHLPQLRVLPRQVLIGRTLRIARHSLMINKLNPKSTRHAAYLTSYKPRCLEDPLLKPYVIFARRPNHGFPGQGCVLRPFTIGVPLPFGSATCRRWPSPATCSRQRSRPATGVGQLSGTTARRAALLPELPGAVPLEQAPSTPRTRHYQRNRPKITTWLLEY
jgi:hypothetical protein